MAISSMTGHGSAERDKVFVELSSVNHKQFDLRLVVSGVSAKIEAELTQQIRRYVARGSVTCRIGIKSGSTSIASDAVINKKIAEAYVTNLRKLARQLNLKDDLALSVVAALPGVCSQSRDEWGTEVQALLFDCLNHALIGLMAMRKEEGKAVQSDIEQRLLKLNALIAKIEKRASLVPKRQMKSLRARIKELGLDIKSDDSRLTREAVLFADRCDISEEITRLNSHLKQVNGKLRLSIPVGRSLDFLIQEINREINTIGAKANDVQIASNVVIFKTELERIREQVQNVE